MRGEWIRWWEDKTFLAILAVALLTMGAALASALLWEWGWLGSIAVALGGGYAVRRIVQRKLDEIDNDKT